MSWIRIDDQAPEHPKMLRAGPTACWLWMSSLAYASRHLTDGEVTREAVATLGVQRWQSASEALVREGLWERTDRGFQIHDYLLYQPSRQQVTDKRKKTADRVSEWKRAHGHIGGNAVTNDVTNDASNADGTPAPVPVPDPDPIPKKTKYNGEVGFAEFWSAYPRKVAKPAAYRAWNKIVPDETVRAVILASVDAWSKCHDWRKAKGMFVPHPATWLNERRWEDALPKDDTATEAFIAEYADEYAAVRGGSYVSTDADFLAAGELLSVYGCRAKSIAMKFISSKSERLDRVPERTIAQLLRHAPAIDAFMRGINHE